MTIEEYTRFVLEILQEDVKEGELMLARSEIPEDKSEITVDFVFGPVNCLKKMSATFDYNEFSNRMNNKKTTLQN